MAGIAEKFHSGMVPHSGDEESRNFKEVVGLGNELKHLEKLIGSEYVAKVGIVFDWENWWALELDSKPSTLVTYIEEIIPFYRALHKQNIGVDFIHPDESLNAYKVIIAPASYQVTNDFSTKVEDYVKKGGVFITNFFNGIVDEHDRVYLGGYPGAYKEVLGIYIEEFAPMKEHAVHQIRTEFSDVYNKVWEENIHLRGAKALAQFKEGYLANSPAVTMNQYGKGLAYYIGTHPDEHYLLTLLKDILKNADIHPLLEAPNGVEVTMRKKGKVAFIFLLM